VPEGVVDRLESIDVEHDQCCARMVAFDIGDRAIELALKAAAVRNIEQEIGIRRSLQLVNSRQCLRQLDLEPANRQFGLVGGDRQPGRRRGSGFHPPGALRRRFALRHTAFTAFRRPRSGRLGFFFMNILEKTCRDSPRQDSPFRTHCHALPKLGPIL